MTPQCVNIRYPYKERSTPSISKILQNPVLLRLVELRTLPNELSVRYSRFYAQLSLRDYDNANEFLLCYYRAASIFGPINSSRTESRLRSCLPLTILVVRAKQQI